MSTSSEKKQAKAYDKLNADFDTLVGAFDNNIDLETQLSNLRTDYAVLKVRGTLNNEI